MWEATNNLFVIIEPGTPSNFKQMKEIREYLLQKGANLIAPCPHAKACPVENNNWCHFTCRISRIKIHKNLKDAESPFEDEKFTYFVFSKNEKTMAKSRVLRHPIYRPKVVSLELCNNNGKIERLEISKSNENYKLARKIKCGDEFV